MTSNLPASTSETKGLSTPLSEQLLNEPSSERAIAEIALTPALRDEARAILPALQAKATRRAGMEGVRNVIGRRIGLYPMPDMGEGAMKEWWGAYFDVLSDVPLASLEAAMRAWVAKPDSQFMPKPGQLRQLALSTPSAAIQAYERAKAAVERPTPKVINPVEAAERRAMVAEVLSSLGSKRA
jgi:hypothetical protein